MTYANSVRIQGRGSPTVILVGGLGDTLHTWDRVQSAIAECTRTMAYDRAGYSGSRPPVAPRDAEHIVHELRNELRRRGIGPPYVLVGHSLGGLYMQYFARQHAEDVEGLVLIDSTHWNEQLLSHTARAGRSTAARHGTVVVFMSWIARRELADSALAGEQVHASPEAAALPTIVLSSTRSAMGETPVERIRAARLQEDIAADYPAAVHLRVYDSGHYIQNDRPDVVVAAVRKLAGCASID